jgi:hypothetical protein
MFEKRKNRNVAKKDFLQILESMKLESSKKVEGEFVASFDKWFDTYEDTLIKTELVVKPPNRNKKFSEKVDEILHSCLIHFEDYVAYKKPEELGQGFGMFMAVIQYGVTGKYFDSSEGQGYDQFYKSTIESVNGIMVLIHKLSKSVQLKYIAERINVISKENKKNLKMNPYINLLSEIQASLSGEIV